MRSAASVFLEFGGFDPRLYPRPAIEDIELGYRLTRAGHRIVLARDVLATHMKRWSLTEMIRTDIFRRGVPWMLLIKRLGHHRDRPERQGRPEGVRGARRQRRSWPGSSAAFNPGPGSSP